MVSFYDALETLPFGSTNNIYIIPFHKQVNSKSIPQFVFAFSKILELDDFFLGRSTCLFYMAHFGLVCTLFCLVIETKLKGCVPVYLFGSDLGNHTWSSF